jgi:hypothetical protein
VRAGNVATASFPSSLRLGIEKSLMGDPPGGRKAKKNPIGPVPVNVK